MSTSQEKKTLLNANNGIILFYNTENFFDTVDNQKTDDDDFLPSGSKRWTQERYYKKNINISSVINSIGSKLPLIIGLAEIENKWIIKDLINSSLIRHGDYDFVHTDSPDERGIDVAFLYRKAYFSPTLTEVIKIILPDDDKTRDILYIKGNFKDSDEWHIFVNHWPSRDGNWQKTAYKRNHVAKRLRSKIDDLLNIKTNSKILIMGDFNDYPSDISIREILKAVNNNELGSDKFFNLSIDLEKKGLGSYCYKGKWGMLDQMMISIGLYNKYKGYSIKNNRMYVFQDNSLFFHHKKYGKQPNKTYGGKKYHGGFSDHLPVYLILEK